MITFLCPYFGKLPNHFDLWIKSVSLNKNARWIIFTNDIKNDTSNVIFKYYSWESFKEMIIKAFDFPVRLDTPYNLCDFKPFYGYIFQEFLTDSDYWGYCDISDTIFGSLQPLSDGHFITGNDEKIGFFGHFSIFKCCKESFLRPFLTIDNEKNVETILNNPNNVGFDELYPLNINKIYTKYGYAVKTPNSLFYDASELFYPFRKAEYIDNRWVIKKNCHTIFKWENGKLYSMSISENKIKKEEIVYVHFQKRKMKFYIKNIDNLDSFFITPSGFFETLNEDVKTFKRLTKNKFFYFQSLKIRMNSFLKRNKKTK